MKHASFNRVVDQAQQAISVVQARLRSQGLKAAKETYRIQLSELHAWIASEVDQKVNTCPVLHFMTVNPRRDFAGYAQELANASNRLVAIRQP